MRKSRLDLETLLSKPWFARSAVESVTLLWVLPWSRRKGLSAVNVAAQSRENEPNPLSYRLPFAMDLLSGIDLSTSIAATAPTAATPPVAKPHPQPWAGPVASCMIPKTIGEIIPAPNPKKE